MKKCFSTWRWNSVSSQPKKAGAWEKWRFMDLVMGRFVPIPRMSFWSCSAYLAWWNLLTSFQVFLTCLRCQSTKKLGLLFNHWEESWQFNLAKPIKCISLIIWIRQSKAHRLYFVILDNACGGPCCAVWALFKLPSTPYFIAVCYDSLYDFYCYQSCKNLLAIVFRPHYPIIALAPDWGDSDSLNYLHRISEGKGAVYSRNRSNKQRLGVFVL